MSVDGAPWHIIDGEEGCAFAVQHGLAVVVVDALRASATTAMMLDHGATQITVVRDVEEALAGKLADPEALLFGERGGLPPAGFDGGNSPRDVGAVRGRRIIFTTTNGARCLVAAQGAPLVMFASTTNATAAARLLLAAGHGVVLVPAGLAGSPKEAATEDRVAAACIAMAAGATIGEGAEIYVEFAPWVSAEGLQGVYWNAPHAESLKEIGLDEDIRFCARVDVTAAVPRVWRYVGRQAVMGGDGSRQGLGGNDVE